MSRPTATEACPATKAGGTCRSPRSQRSQRCAPRARSTNAPWPHSDSIWRVRMTELLVRPSAPGQDGTILCVTPESAQWTYVGFEVLALATGLTATRECGQREVCIVVVNGTVEVSADALKASIGGRPDPWSGSPEAAYLPPGSNFTLRGEGEVALCWAPASQGARARVLPGD